MGAQVEATVRTTNIFTVPAQALRVESFSASLFPQARNFKKELLPISVGKMPFMHVHITTRFHRSSPIIQQHDLSVASTFDAGHISVSSRIYFKYKVRGEIIGHLNENDWKCAHF